MVMSWFRCIAEAIAHKGLRGILQEVPGGAWLYDVSSDAYQRMRERGQDERICASDRQKCEAQAKADQAAVEVQMAELAAEVIPNEPPATQRALADYLAIIPSRMRQAFQRQDDPTGTTVPADWLIERPEDVQVLLPPRPARFHIGDSPPGREEWIMVQRLGIGGFDASRSIGQGPIEDHRLRDQRSDLAAFSVSASNVEKVQRYIRNQKKHHAKQTFQDEMRLVYTKHGVEWDERYAWD